MRVKLAWLSTVHLMSWKTVPTTSSPSVSCAEMYAWPWGGWGRGEGWVAAEAVVRAGSGEGGSGGEGRDGGGGELMRLGQP